MEERKLTKVTVIENRSGRRSEGWPKCLYFEFAHPYFPLYVPLNSYNHNEGQIIADAINRLIKE